MDSDFKTQAVTYFQKNNFKKAEIKLKLRTIGTVIDFETFIKEKKIVLYDCPQTLRAAFKAVEIVSAMDYIGNDEYANSAKEKEVKNFISTVKNQIITNEYTKKTVKIKRFW